MDINLMMATSRNRQHIWTHTVKIWYWETYNWESYNGLCTKYD